jgi:sugar lactone lactonase YvrE
MMRTGGMMNARTWWALGLVMGLAACGGDDSEPAEDSGTPDAEDSGTQDAGDAAVACPTGGPMGTLQVEIEIAAGVDASVRIADAHGELRGAPLTASGSQSLPAGIYSISAHRVRKAGTQVGPAYQGEVTEDGDICVRSAATTTAHVVYTREPGSERLWLTQSNGDGAPVQAFDAHQLDTLGDQTPGVTLKPGLDNVGPIRVDGRGRLWVGSNTGKLVAFDSARLGTSSSEPPDVVLEGPALCDDAVPCGPRSLAFDAEGALWVATLQRIVKLAPESLEASGEPEAAVTITSSDVHTPEVLAFDHAGNLWAGESEDAIVRFDAARLSANIDDEPADVVIFTQQPGPVMLGLSAPSGLAFDADDNLWVGYFAGNDLIRLTTSERAESAPRDMPLVPSVHFKIEVGALVTDLAIDEAGNLWLPGGHTSDGGSVYRVSAGALVSMDPHWSVLSSAGIGSVERLTLNTVPDTTFIAP